MKKATTTTPDPEISVPLGTVPPEDLLGGQNPRGETAGCPTGMITHPQTQPPQPGGSPDTGEPKTDQEAG